MIHISRVYIILLCKSVILYSYDNIYICIIYIYIDIYIYIYIITDKTLANIYRYYVVGSL